MKYVALADHLHQLRYVRTGRAIGTAMSVMEVWSGALESDLNGVDEIQYFETDLPRPFDGMFIRLVSEDGSRTRVAIYIDRSLERHWKEFVLIKELMHCWSPASSHTGTSAKAADLVNAINSRHASRYATPAVEADLGAVYAAAEVILPHTTLERYVANGLSPVEIGHRCGMHPDIAELICRWDTVHHRKNGHL